ncbi:MAG: peptidylprolyl isomerase [Oscillospiraceae bacterium]|jgi:peptidyl-prolyl cis-trans isomerase B (cyclophilin B)|nr:peptidylprolyl isomerase [Oscillospiraceae bacterium]
MKKFGKLIPFLFAALVLVLVACNQAAKPDETTGESTTGFVKPADAEDPLATIELESGKKILVQLLPEDAPNTVYNFISLANKGYYNGLTFHRASADTLIQGGDPNGNGSGGPGYKIKGEFSANGVENNLKHTRGTISMARQGNDNDSAGSQFFIVAAYAFPDWDGQYAAFGRVLDGMEVVDEISQQPVKSTQSGALAENVVIKSVTIETHGVAYPEPETIPAS